MAGPLIQAHAQRLEALRKTRHVLQGESGEISFLKRNPNNNALVDLFIVNQSWSYSDRDKDGANLPLEVLYELQVAEPLITKANLRLATVIKHGQRIFRFIHPSPFEPSGLDRYWRFWIAPSEEV